MKHDTRLANFPLTRQQHVFVTVWFNMTHAYSLDSHRVRVMHALNILEELMRVSSYAHAKAEDRAMIGREAIGILGTEAVLQRERFAVPTKVIHVLLEKVYGQSAEKGAADRLAALLDSHLREYIALLSAHYLDELFDGLHAALLEPDARGEPEQFNGIRSLCGALLSYLLARGQSLEGLFALYRQVLVPVKASTKPYVFAQRFDLLRRIVMSPITSWRAYFAVDGITDVAAFPDHIGDIRFVRQLPGEVAGLRNMNERPRRLYATGEIEAVDMRAAGQLLHEQINRVLDLVRFEYDHANISVGDDFAACRSAGGYWRVLPIPKVVPNPRAAVSGEELHRFAGNVSRLVTGERFSQEGRERVLSAFRLYRTGADTTNFENKLVNWWTGLEQLAKGAGGTGSIGGAVESSLTPVLMGVSIANHLSAYREVLLEQSIELVNPADGRPVALKELDFAQLYTVLAHPAHRQTINDRLRDLPLTQMRFDQFMGFLASPADMKTFLGRVEQGLRWHLQRIWRARCDIVHSAGRMINIALLCANLEAYLKSVLTALLAAFGRIPTLASPTEFFIRAEHSYASARDALGRGDAGALKMLLTELKSQ
ncbi:hypothetical protein [Paraburkholderia ginsengisoli]|uniref:Uncharacterized protein n=1 Tax=Paraburkholderia ginsengisoli TaxID=311231 RepID=A0A7T4N9V5_9BURK|nr:hypothetical protein [Paraburkholderia ginsengisoli]QQC67904.1 hypothetical protein I6I06_29270 [Paraburkholderia ginsengisoli]